MQELRHGGLAVPLGRSAFCLESHQMFGPEGASVNLRAQSARVLALLVQMRGQLVTRDELIEAVWPGVAVSDDSLTQCIADIRRALGQGDRAILQTVPKRGYVLKLPQAPDAPAEAARPRRLVVMPFDDLPGSRAGLGADLAQRLVDRLERAGGVAVELGRASNPVGVRDLGDRTGATHILSGHVFDRGADVLATVDCADAQLGRVVWSGPWVISGGAMDADQALGQIADRATRTVLARV